VWNLLGSLGLFLDIMLSPALRRLASVMLTLELGLLGTVAGDARDGSSERASDAVTGARGEVAKLAAGLLLLSRQVLLSACLLQVL
jgi:hypothetical protein